jgi:anti-sigma factor RsiW
VTEPHLSCNVVVELLTDYLDGALDPATTTSLERHLELCPPCVALLDQLRTTIDAVGHVQQDTLSEDTLTALEAAFRGYHPPTAL